MSKRCNKCKIPYKGHRTGKYSPRLKSMYEREGAKGKFVKIGYKCPACGRFFKLGGKRKL